MCCQCSGGEKIEKDYSKLGHCHLREAWLRGEVFDRTNRLVPPPPHQLSVKHHPSGTQVGFNLPDLAGETIESFFVTRSIPQNLWERIKKADGLLLFVHCDHNADHTILEHPGFIDPGVNVVFSDLENHGKSELRDLFFAYGSDLEKPRHAFLKLVKAYTSLSSNLDWGERLRSISTIFPNESEAIRLKEMLVTPDSPANLEREWSTAAFLLSCPEAKAYAKVSFNHIGLAPNLWNQKREDVLALIARLVRQDENPSSTAFTKAIGKCIAPDDLRSIALRHPELIPVFISQRTELAHEVGTWELPGYVQSQIFEVLEGLSLSQEEWGKIMGAMFLAATYVSVNSAVRNSGSYAIQGAFRWLNHEISMRLLPSPEWRVALVEVATHELADGKILAPAELAFCSWIVPPEIVHRWLSVSRKDVLKLSTISLEDLPKPLRSYTAFVLVTVGLRSRALEGAKLIKCGYFTVQDILANNWATSDEWALLAPELPRIGWGEWDRCEKLRRAVRKWLSKYAKGINLLEEAATTEREVEIAREIITPPHRQKDNEEFIN